MPRWDGPCGMSSQHSLPATSSQRPNLGNASPVWTGTTAAQPLLLSVQRCPAPAWRLQLQHTKHLGKKTPGAVGTTLAEAQSDSFTSQKSSNLPKFKESSSLGRVCYCPGDPMPLILLTVIWCKQGGGCRQQARL